MLVRRYGMVCVYIVGKNGRIVLVLGHECVHKSNDEGMGNGMGDFLRVFLF